MKALIIAAGDGTRLSKYTKTLPKSLLKINGKTILETILTNCKSLGIKDFVIVTGYLQERFRKFLTENIINKMGINVEFVSNPYFEKENGISAYCAKDVLKNEKNFLLLMSDHIFHPSLLKTLLTVKIDNGCALAIDKNISEIYDIEDATKVYEVKGKIKDIGKNLKSFNAVDTGFFLCTPELFTALEKQINKGNDKLSDAMRFLAKKGNLASVDVSGKFWLDIDTERDLEFAKHRISKITG